MPIDRHTPGDETPADEFGRNDETRVETGPETGTEKPDHRTDPKVADKKAHCHLRVLALKQR